MRIAYVTETWPPEVNGVALTTARTVEFLRRRHNVQVVRPRQEQDNGSVGNYADTVLVRGMPIPFYRDLRMGLPSAKRLQECWNADPPDLVHIATEGPLGWSALNVAQRLGVVATTDFRTRFDQYARHYALGGCARLALAYLRRFHNRSARTFVPTEEIRQELQGAGFRNLAVTSRGVDIKRFSPEHRSMALRREWGQLGTRQKGEDPPVVLYVGRLASEKNIPLVIRTWQAMRDYVPSVRLLMVGDGPLRASLQRAYPEVIFAGVLRDAELAACYASADLFLFPSMTETFGNVTLEAMASGLAVTAFATAAAGMHIRDGVNGRTVRPGDEDAFVSAAVELVKAPACMRFFGSEARITAEGLSWDSVLSHFESRLGELALSHQNYERACLA